MSDTTNRDRNTIPDRPILDRNGTLYYQSNKVVAYLLQTATLRGAIDVVKLKQIHSDGGFPEADYREFCQLIGFKVNAYRALFPEPIPPHPRPNRPSSKS